jgi:hypothetical protein
MVIAFVQAHYRLPSLNEDLYLSHLIPYFIKTPPSLGELVTGQVDGFLQTHPSNEQGCLVCIVQHLSKERNHLMFTLLSQVLSQAFCPGADSGPISQVAGGLLASKHLEREA